MINEQNKKKEWIAFTGLITAALLWGVSYPLTKFVEDCPTFYIIAIRFAVAAAGLSIVFWKSYKNFNFDILKYGFLLSFCVAAMFVFNILGIKYTTSVRASFFTCLSFLIVPLINLFVFKVRFSRIIAISALICLIGMALLCYAPGIGGLIINPGDILCIGAATAGSLHIIFVEKVSKKETIDPTLFTIFLMAFVALWGVLIALFRGDFSYTGTSGSQMLVIILMGLLCSAAAFTLQSHFEAVVPANRVGVIFALEPASGCILSVLLLKESMGLTSWAGAFVIMASIFYMEFANNRAEVEK